MKLLSSVRQNIRRCKEFSGGQKTGGTVVESKEDALLFKPSKGEKPICVVAQTTFNYKKFQELVEIFSKKGYDILAVNTICNATSNTSDGGRVFSKGF